jgi:SAM-dependent methyltransferase
MQSEMMELVSTYTWPSQAFWRYFELNALRQIKVEHPILEIGCGDGKFSSLIFDSIEEAIDVNPKSIEKAKERTEGFYKLLRCMDARDLQPTENGFGTVYANCVMEHIPSLENVLSGCYRSLRKGGTLLITVPLVEMNHHLMLPFRRYARLRQQQLAHHNLLSPKQWDGLLSHAGFTTVEFRPYLGAKACSFWDSIDTLGCVGSGRYCVSSALRLLARTFLPRSIELRFNAALARWLERNIEKNSDLSAPCATVILATK